MSLRPCAVPVACTLLAAPRVLCVCGWGGGGAVGAICTVATPLRPYAKACWPATCMR